MIIQGTPAKAVRLTIVGFLTLLIVGCPSTRDLPTTTVVTMPIDGVEVVVTLDGTTFTVGEPINFKVEAPRATAEGDRRLVDEVVCSIVPAAESDPVESARHPIVWDENGGNLVCNVQNIFRVPDDSDNTKISKILPTGDHKLIIELKRKGTTVGKASFKIVIGTTKASY